MLSSLQKAQRHLARSDRVLKQLIQVAGPCTLCHDSDHFGVLARSIISQQISTKAALSIGKKVLATVRKLAPANILKAEEAALRAAGLSANKLRSLRDLAEKCRSGAVPLQRLAGMADEEVIDALLPVRGIGRWTAEMFLMFSLGRLDVLPVGDLGLRAGVQKQYGLADLPGKDELTSLAAPWQPYRSIGTWYIWRSFGNVPQSK